MHCVVSRFGYPNYRWSRLVRIIDVLLYFHMQFKCRRRQHSWAANNVFASYLWLRWWPTVQCLSKTWGDNTQMFSCNSCTLNLWFCCEILSLNIHLTHWPWNIPFIRHTGLEAWTFIRHADLEILNSRATLILRLFLSHKVPCVHKDNVTVRHITALSLTVRSKASCKQLSVKNVY